MKKRILNQRIGLAAFILLLIIFLVPSIAQAADIAGDKSVSITLINTAVAFFIFAFGVWITYLTRGGFLSISFILITAGIMVGWVSKIGFEFLTNSSILSTNFDVVGISEALGGIILVAGFVLLSQKLKG
ncbi:MAG: hypothetical protein AB1743_00700 [Actinomycetota bacterium]